MRSYTVLLAVLITAAQAQEEPLPPTGLPLLDDAVEQCSHSGALECYALLAAVAERLPGEAWPQFYLGLVLHQGGIDADAATRAYERALALDPGHVDALCNLGKMRSDAVRAEGPSDAAVALWTRALEIDPLHRMARVNLALDLHRRGRFDAATVHWDELLRRHPADPEVLYNAGVTRAHRGEVPVAADLYQACLERAPDHVEARINLAALYHKHGTPRDAVEHYRRALDSLRRVGPALGEDGDPADAETMIHGNLGVALTQLGEGDEAVAAHAAGLRIAEARGMVDAADQARTHLLKARVPHCDWVARDAMLAEILDVDRRRMDRGERPALLPFDTLLVDMPPRARTRHAVYTSRALEHYGDLLPPPAPNAPNGSLRVAYMCYDFNDHPTAHLVEGLFRWHRRFKDAFRSARGPRALEAVAALGYGKDDHSAYRDAIAADADAFINDLALLGHVDAVVASRDFGAQIVVDLQGHTLGTRMELCMARVAPVQLAYLIYPGTSGASCLDGAVVDPVVVPPEAARVYTERLVYLPGTYQVNDYERHAAVAAYAAAPGARAAHGLPPRPFVVFCNFNKVDKLDPASFGLWMNVLRRAPGSVLWLLRPKGRQFDHVAAHLEAEAAARGVHPARLVWADRVPKAEHLRRHAAADLLLDTLVYGAHSTATDALRGGLPLLTVRGEQFPQRVGASLLRAVGADQELLAVDSLRDFEDLAVLLAGTRRLRALRARLADEGRASRLFDTRAFTRDLERAFHAVWEGHALAGRLAHHVVVLEDVLPEPALTPFHGGPLPSFESVLPGAWASTEDVGVR
jgi:tetratricopeptide (TPR) repeat protein